MSSYRTYDHRIKELIVKTKNPNLFPNLNIPRSTALGWIRNGVRPVVTASEVDLDRETLIQRVSNLELKLGREQIKNEIVVFTFRIFGLEIQYRRLAKQELKERFLDKIKTATKTLPLKDCLDAIGLSFARYFSWLKRQVRCKLEDQISCPRLSPTKITAKEVSLIKEHVTSKDLIHYSIPSLSWLLKRKGIVFASLSSWYRVIHEFNLKRPLTRIYPPKPKIGIRAGSPNEIWHVDQNVIRLKNQTKVFVQAIIDNYSRYILAWKVSLDWGGLRTKMLLEQALGVAKTFYPMDVPMVISDSGSENLNFHVNELIIGGSIKHLVAQIDIVFSNSMIEAFFRSLKYRWLYLISLESFDSVRTATEKYINDYNNKIPNFALHGGTPFEVFSGKWTDKSQEKLKLASSVARTNRSAVNKALSCGLCPL